VGRGVAFSKKDNGRIKLDPESVTRACKLVGQAKDTRRGRSESSPKSLRQRKRKREIEIKSKEEEKACRPLIPKNPCQSLCEPCKLSIRDK